MLDGLPSHAVGCGSLNEEVWHECLRAGTASDMCADIGPAVAGAVGAIPGCLSSPEECRSQKYVAGPCRRTVGP